MTTVSLAAAVNRNARGMVSVLRALERQGVVVKNGRAKALPGPLLLLQNPLSKNRYRRHLPRRKKQNQSNRS